MSKLVRVFNERADGEFWGRDKQFVKRLRVKQECKFVSFDLRLLELAHLNVSAGR